MKRIKEKLEPAYKHLVQKPFLCGPCCVQMILLRRGLGWFDQEKIAFEFKVKPWIGSKFAFMFPFKFVKKKQEAGPYIKELAQEFRRFAKKHKLLLEIKLYKISEVENPTFFIARNLKNGNDIIVNFWLKPVTNANSGHFVLIAAINGKTVELCDPGDTDKSFWKANIDNIIYGMSKKWDGNERGFIVVSDKE